MGAEESTVTLTTAESPVLPAESVALVWKVCAPWERPVAEYVQELAVPPVATNSPASTEMVVVERLVSPEVPERAIVVELEKELSLGEEMVEVGPVLSKVTAEESVVAVTCVPGFPAKSVKLMVKETDPSLSLINIVCVADQEVGPPVTEAEDPAMVTVGVETASEEVKVKVTTSPTFAYEVLVLLETM